MKNIVVFFLCISCSLFAQNRKKLDSLLNLEKTNLTDTARIKNQLLIAKRYQKINSDSGYYYLSIASDNCRKNGNKKLLMECLYVKCNILENTGNYREIRDSLLKLYANPDLSTNKIVYIYVCQKLGIYYRKMSIYDKAISYFLKAISTSQLINSKVDLYYSYNGIANVYSEIGEVKKSEPDLKRAFDYFEKAKQNIDKEKTNYNDLVAKTANNQATTYYILSTINKDSSYIHKAIQLSRISIFNRIKNEDSAALASNYGNLGSMYIALYNMYPSNLYLDSSGYYFNKAVSLSERFELADSYAYLGQYANYLATKAKKEKDKILAEKAITYLKESFKSSNSNSDYSTSLSTSEQIAQTYIWLGKNDSAVKYLMQKSAIKDTILNGENKKIAEEMTYKYESDLKDAENNYLKNQAQLKEEVISKKSNTINLMIIASVLLLGLVALVLVSRQKINKSRLLIEQQQLETEKQRLIIQEKNKEIIDSINYAKRLQDAAIPSIDYFKSLLATSFIFYQPKDIVAGDFYWVYKLKNSNKLLVAAADCTGHGVPGSLVSIVCLNALNRCVDEFKLFEPAKILDQTTHIIQESFRQQENDVQDGMDIALILIDLDTNKGLFAGANNPLLLFTQNKLVELKGDNQPVGKQHKPLPFTQHEFQLAPNDLIFLFTDGYADQFGGDNGKKMKSKVFKENLESYAHLSIKEIHSSVEQQFNNWKGTHEQVDDILVMGIKL